jgi:hypothetical protein
VTVTEAPRHTHVWRLAIVDFDAGCTVEQFECACGASWCRA